MKKLFLIGLGGIMASALTFGFFHIPRNTVSIFSDASNTVATSTNGGADKEEGEHAVIPVEHVATPHIVKAVYLTAPSAGREDKIKAVLAMQANGLNAVVIDIKDSFGMVAYDSQLDTVKQYKLSRKFIPDLAGVVKRFHDKGIYVIARIAVFQDTAFAEARPDLGVQDGAKLKAAGGVPSAKTLWRDNKKLAWVDPSSSEVRAYVAALSKDVLAYGFDELNYDYIRFPSDGTLSNVGYPITVQGASHVEAIKSFMQFLRQQMKGIIISADVFGFTMIKTEDIGIGQMAEDAYASFDYVSPMVYPSHYPTGFMGYKNPADHPYEVVNDSMQKGQARLDALTASSTAPTAKLRPWLQDFNLGATYDAAMIDKQIKATKDALGEKYAGYMLWNPSSAYTNGGIQ